MKDICSMLCYVRIYEFCTTSHCRHFININFTLKRNVTYAQPSDLLTKLNTPDKF